MRTLGAVLGLSACLLLAGCGPTHLPRTGTRYYVGEVQNADLILAVTPSKSRPGTYWVRTAPAHIGHPLPGWEVSRAEIREALQKTKDMGPLWMRPEYYRYATHTYFLYLRRIRHPITVRHCEVSFHVGATLYVDGNSCSHLYSAVNFTPVSGSDWGLQTNDPHRFYPVS